MSQQVGNRAQRAGAGQGEAWVFDGPGLPLRRIQQPLPVLQPGELRVEVLGCTLCGSDLHTYTGRRAIGHPAVLGHEIVGRLVEVGPDTTLPAGIEPEGRLTWTLCAHCDSCFYCRRELPQKCIRLFKYGHAAHEQFPFAGGLADSCILRPGTQVFPLADSLSDEIACLANCAGATAAAALRIARVTEGDVVLIYGAGVLGLLAACMARESGAQVVLADPDARRAGRAASFGAVGVELATGHDRDAGGPNAVERALQAVAPERGADVVLEMSGAADAARGALQNVRTGGAVILVGAVFPGPQITLELEQVVRRLLRIEGLHNYHPRDLQAALHFLTNHQDHYPLATLIEDRFSRDQAEAAFQAALRPPRPLRVFVGR